MSYQYFEFLPVISYYSFNVAGDDGLSHGRQVDVAADKYYAFARGRGCDWWYLQPPGMHSPLIKVLPLIAIYIKLAKLRK